MMFGPSCGRELARWIEHGRPALDLHSMDVARFHPALAADGRWLKETSHESYARNYSTVFPHVIRRRMCCAGRVLRGPCADCCCRQPPAACLRRPATPACRPCHC